MPETKRTFAISVFVARSGRKTGEPDCQAAFVSMDEAIDFLADLHGLAVEDCRRLKRQMAIPLKHRLHGADRCSIEKESMPAARAEKALSGELYLRDAARVLTPRKINQALKQDIKIRPRKKAKSIRTSTSSPAKPKALKIRPKGARGPKSAVRIPVKKKATATGKTATRKTRPAVKQSAKGKLVRLVKSAKPSASTLKKGLIRKKTPVKTAKIAKQKRTASGKPVPSTIGRNVSKKVAPEAKTSAHNSRGKIGPSVPGFARPRSFSNDRNHSLQRSLFKEAEGPD
jgi:hypothetical protein